MIVYFIGSLPTLLLPRRFARACIRSCAFVTLWLLRVICGVRSEFRGIEKLPKTACIVACKHQSAWETFALYTVLHDPIFILKRELMWMPFFGWYTWKAGYIGVDRGAGVAALNQMTAHAQAALARGDQLVIFPEGTRRPPGAEPDYKPGTFYLYGKTKVPCVPVALNSGLHWPRRSFLRPPGTIIAEILDPIPPGLNRATFSARLQDAIEDATARLGRE
ncbi:MAG TPA: lysophospholipid acyltransferase family protein [Xanthobacteraceae bacterium]|nr:lysophospholipid acyltransferase family protein [Xanthobacteraceae bacterium]